MTSGCRPTTGFICLDCGKLKIGQTYANRRSDDGKTELGKVCDECAYLEELQWMRDNGKAFLYVNRPCGSVAFNHEVGPFTAPDRFNHSHQWRLTTWPGEVVADRVVVRSRWTSLFGDTRVSIRFYFEGEVWSGIYYESAGDYARCRRTKLKSIYS